MQVLLGKPHTLTTNPRGRHENKIIAVLVVKEGLCWHTPKEILIGKPQNTKCTQGGPKQRTRMLSRIPYSDPGCVCTWKSRSSWSERHAACCFTTFYSRALVQEEHDLREGLNRGSLVFYNGFDHVFEEPLPKRLPTVLWQVHSRNKSALCGNCSGCAQS